jgi:hypothetical protein
MGSQAATRITARRIIPGRSIGFPADRARLRRGDCRGTVRGVGRHRHGRIDPRSFRHVRDCRPEADVRARQRIRHGAARAVVRPHVGPLARSVRTRQSCSACSQGAIRLDPTSSAHRVEDYRGALRKPLRKFRLGRPREHYWEKLDAKCAARPKPPLRDMEKHGAVVREVSLPHLKESLDAATIFRSPKRATFTKRQGYFPGSRRRIWRRGAPANRIWRQGAGASLPGRV